AMTLPCPGPQTSAGNCQQAPARPDPRPGLPAAAAALAPADRCGAARVLDLPGDQRARLLARRTIRLQVWQRVESTRSPEQCRRPVSWTFAPPKRLFPSRARFPISDPDTQLSTSEFAAPSTPLWYAS